MKTDANSAPEKLADLQTRFAAHIRDPQINAAPDGIEDRRMAIYRDLFFNNIKSFLSSNFPVLHSLYCADDWDQLCRDFYRDHQCHTPLFPELPREFLQYLQTFPDGQLPGPAFMLELAHYEWVELGLQLDETDPDEIEFTRDGDLLNGVPVVSPLAWPLSYNYPVHQIKKDFQPASKPDEATHLLVWRQFDFQIKFMQLNAVSLMLLQRMKQQPDQTGAQHLSSIAGILNHPKPEIVIQGGTSLLQDLHAKQVVFGTRPCSGLI